MRCTWVLARLALAVVLVGLICAAPRDDEATRPPASGMSGTLPRATPSVPPRMPWFPMLMDAASSPTPPPAMRSYFPLGVFEDGNLQDVDSYSAMIAYLEAYSLDTAFIGNSSVTKANDMLAVSDQANFNTILAASELYSRWWDNPSVVVDINTARGIIYPIADALKRHASLKGYYYVDEPGFELQAKMALAQQAFNERSPGIPAFPVLVGADRVAEFYRTIKPPVLVADVYPFGAENPPCNTAMTGFGYPSSYDMVDYLRDALSTKPAGAPAWIILQSHRLGNPGESFALRQPSVQELREEHWLAIGEGVTGIFWFMYSSEQGWLGLKDNPALFTEVGVLARRIDPLRPLLLSLHKTGDQIGASGRGGAAYASTLTDAPGSHTYAVIVNRSCAPQDIVITSASGQKQLRDLETGQVYFTGAALPFAGGDGRVFEVSTNLVIWTAR